MCLMAFFDKTARPCPFCGREGYESHCFPLKCNRGWERCGVCLAYGVAPRGARPAKMVRKGPMLPENDPTYDSLE